MGAIEDRQDAVEAVVRRPLPLTCHAVSRERERTWHRDEAGRVGVRRRRGLDDPMVARRDPHLSLQRHVRGTGAPRSLALRLGLVGPDVEGTIAFRAREVCLREPAPAIRVFGHRREIHSIVFLAVRAPLQGVPPAALDGRRRIVLGGWRNRDGHGAPPESHAHGHGAPQPDDREAGANDALPPHAIPPAGNRTSATFNSVIVSPRYSLRSSEYASS